MYIYIFTILTWFFLFAEIWKWPSKRGTKRLQLCNQKLTKRKLYMYNIYMIHHFPLIDSSKDKKQKSYDLSNFFCHKFVTIDQLWPLVMLIWAIYLIFKSILKLKGRGRAIWAKLTFPIVPFFAALHGPCNGMRLSCLNRDRDGGPPPDGHVMIWIRDLYEATHFS